METINSVGPTDPSMDERGPREAQAHANTTSTTNPQDNEDRCVPSALRPPSFLRDLLTLLLPNAGCGRPEQKCGTSREVDTMRSSLFCSSCPVYVCESRSFPRRERDCTADPPRLDVPAEP